MRTTSRQGMRAVWCGLFAVALAGTGCELITAPDRTKIEATGGAGGEGGTGGTGGTTSMAECAVAEDCPDTGNECLERACVDQTCTPSPVADGTAVASQTTGDCQVMVCDGAGATKSDADDADLPVDGQECTGDVCTAGVPSNPPVTEGTACGAGGALFCDAAGACVGCLTDDQCGAPTDCATPVCNAGTCETTFADPSTPTPTQTDGDCLEVQCDGIGGTKIVNDDADILDDGNQCTSDVCDNGAATHPNQPSGTTCSDGGIKCDGSGACVECLTGGDCMSGVCTSQVCAAPGCLDNVENGTETDLDCGGSCPPCDDGLACLVDGDCTSEVCTGTVCQAPSCSDGVTNGNETDLNCGGGTCPDCGPGLACLANSDCVGGSCVGNTCVPTCTDLVKNGTETDVDCGGTCAANCDNGETCGADADCSSAHCAGSVCVECVAATDCPATGNECVVATCNANVCGTMNLDGTHTLSTGQTANDCQKVVCNGNGGTTSADDATDLPASTTACLINPACTGTPLAPSFTPAAQGASCVSDGMPPNTVCGGGLNAGICVECNTGLDCPSGVCNNNVCAAASCSDMLQNGTETDVDCGGASCPDCADGDSCLVAGDCASGICTTNVCQAAPTCSDALQNGNETDVDCGGGTCSDCADGDSCLAGSDCLSGVCTTNVCQAPTCSDGVQNGTETGVDCGGSCLACAGGACAGNAQCASGMCYDSACVDSVNGCTIATATDLTGGAPVTITFANGNFTYAPKCVKVSANTDVTFAGNFASHPLEGGTVDMGMEMVASSGPFVPATTTGTSAVFTMSTAGTFPYYCIPHGTLGMNGAVFVVP